MIDKYDLSIKWDAKATDDRFPSDLYETLRKSKMISISRSNGAFIFTGVHYVMQNFVKNGITMLTEHRKESKLSTGINARHFNEIRKVEIFNKVFEITQEDWSYAMKNRWNAMNSEIVEALHTWRTYLKADYFLEAMINHNSIKYDTEDMKDSDVEILREMYQFILERERAANDKYGHMKYQEIHDAFWEKTDLAFPTVIRW